MTLLSDERRAVPKPDDAYGAQMPRVFTTPGGFVASGSGQEAIELAEMVGVHLDPWQRYVVDVGLREKTDGAWAAEEVAVCVPRQNGKGEIIAVRELAGLYLLGEKKILHTAHQFKTAMVGFQRIRDIIDGSHDLRKRVRKMRSNTSEVSITLRTGQELHFLARSGSSGRGFTGNCNMFDECMDLGDQEMDALMPTMAAVVNAQSWYLGSAGIGAPSVQLARLRARAMKARESGEPDPIMSYFEWSIDPHVDECREGCTEHDDPGSDEAILTANPAIGYRLTLEKSRNERLAMSPTGFARERLGVGEYPADGANTWQVISEDPWRALADAQSHPDGPIVFAIDTTPERSYTAISVAGPWRGGTHVEVAVHRPGTGWVIDWAKERHEKHKPRAWVIDPASAAGSLIPDLERELGITVVKPKARDVAAAAGQFYDAVIEQSLSHIDEAPLASALAGAEKRPLGDAWAFTRRPGSGADISPLVAATLAKWGLSADIEEPKTDLHNNIW